MYTDPKSIVLGNLLKSYRVAIYRVPSYRVATQVKIYGGPYKVLPDHHRPDQENHMRPSRALSPGMRLFYPRSQHEFPGRSKKTIPLKSTKNLLNLGWSEGKKFMKNWVKNDTLNFLAILMATH